MKKLRGLFLLILLLFGQGCNTAPHDGPPDTAVQLYSSIQLISQDLASGEISRDEAYVLKTYALFDAEKLTPRYRSVVPFKGATMVIRDLRRAFDGLGEGAKVRIRPYLFPEGRKKGRK